MIGVDVTIAADDLERLVRRYHEWLPDTAAMLTADEFIEDGIEELAPWLSSCACGERIDQRDHGTHVAYHVRQALAGRIEFP